MEAAALAFCWAVLGEKQEAWFKKEDNERMVGPLKGTMMYVGHGKKIVRDKCMCVYVRVFLILYIA